MHKIAKKSKEALSRECKRVLEMSKEAVSLVALDTGLLNTKQIQILRTQMKQYGTLMKSKKKIMLKALSTHGSTEAKLTEKTHLFFVERDADAALSAIENFSALGFLKIGDIAPTSFVICKGVVKARDIPISAREGKKLEACGIPVSIEEDVVVLKEDFCICTKGSTIGPKSEETLRILKIEPSLHKAKILSVVQKRRL